LALAPIWLAIFAYVHVTRIATARRLAMAGRVALAGTAGLAAWLAVLLPVALAVPPDASHAALAYAAALALAALAATGIAGRILPRPARDAGMALCAGLAMAYPAILAMTSAPTAPVQRMQLLYFAASALGGAAAILRRTAPATAPVTAPVTAPFQTS
jgi:hypothetical protein